MDFTAPFSPPGFYTADTWGTGNHEGRVEIGIFLFLIMQWAMKFHRYSDHDILLKVL